MKPAAMEPKDCVASHDVPVAILQKKILSARSPEDKARFEKELDELIQAREIVRDAMNQIVEKCTDSPEEAQQVMKGKSSAHSSKTYKEVVEYFRKKGFNWHDPKYQTALQHLYVFANLIEKKVPVERIKAAIDEVNINPKKERVEGTASPNTENE
ncbi:legumain-like isoform X2 [Pygocentrus nattereri]|uniref:legumain-like isoform X2 n=1 Tax=Pygocentrus nattereri TaxID=42514 RepID=UPI000814ACAE|nr:legumain-like isoform X2 [Pygocentrus nattereri]